MWLAGTHEQMIPPFSMFQGGRELENFPRGIYKNDMKSIMKLLKREENRDGG